MKHMNVKVILFGLAIIGSVLGLRPTVNHDLEGEITLGGLTTMAAKASVSEGHRVLNACDGQPGYYFYSCDASSTNFCVTTTCSAM